MQTDDEPGPKRSRVGSEIRQGPCRFCGRTLHEYAAVGSPQTSMVEHESPWCDGFTALASQHGLGAEPNPKDDENDHGD